MWSVVVVPLYWRGRRTGSSPMRHHAIYLGSFYAALAIASGAAAQPAPAVTSRTPEAVSAETLYRDATSPRAPTHALRLTFGYFPAAGWGQPELIAAARAAAAILGQCRVRIEAVELVALEGERRFQDFDTPVARELARRVPLPRPAVYFVADSRQRPAFDAEAIGRGNSRTRPELADTVWVTRGTRDLGIVLAHELVHVLIDSGEHSRAHGNLMREDTAPTQTLLDAEQCDRLRAVGAAHGLLTETMGNR